jgi:hypothetical protein
MRIVVVRKEFTDILTKVLLSIPNGFVFDEEYIVERLSSEYPDKYLHFLALYADRETPMEMATEEICVTLRRLEGILVEEQNLKVHFPTLHSALTGHKVWKKI